MIRGKIKGVKLYVNKKTTSNDDYVKGKKDGAVRGAKDPGSG